MKKESFVTSKLRKPTSGFWAFAFLVAIFLQATTLSFAATVWRVSGLSSTGGANSGVGISGTSYNGNSSKGLIFTAGESGKVIDAIGIRLIGVSPFNVSATLNLTIASVNQTTNALTGVLATDNVSFTSPPGNNFATSKEYTFGPASLLNISQLSLVAGTKYAMTVWGANALVVTLANAPYLASVYTNSQTGGFTFVGLESAGNAYSGLNYYLAVGKNVADIPTITSFTPTSAGTGTTVTITGTNFTGATAVSFGGTAANSYSVVSATSITAVVSSGTSGSVSVTTAGGTASLKGFTYVPAPTISSFTPTSAGTGTTVTITGTNFTEASAVSFSGTAASSYSVVSATSITAVVASGTTGSVSVTTAGGTATLAGFAYVSAPTITSFTPTSAGTGTTVTITGTNFTGATAVSFGGTVATSFSVVDATSITAVVAGGTSGSVSVTTAGGPATLTGFGYFTTADAPTNLSATPGDGSASISFTAPLGDGGSSITNYEYSTDNGSNWTARAPAATSTTFDITGLVNGTTYQVKLRAVNAAGSGTASTSVDVTPIACSNPTSGGKIAVEQSGAAPFNPAAFTCTTRASGQSGTMQVLLCFEKMPKSADPLTETSKN